MKYLVSSTRQGEDPFYSVVPAGQIRGGSAVDFGDRQSAIKSTGGGYTHEEAEWIAIIAKYEDMVMYPNDKSPLYAIEPV